MKDNSTTTDPWLGTFSSNHDLAAQYDHESQSLKLVRKGEGVQGRGCIMILAWGIVALFAGAILATAGVWDVGAWWFAWIEIAVILVVMVIAHQQQLEIDTKTHRLVRRSRGFFVPWTWKSSTPINHTARFIVRMERHQEEPDEYVLYFVPYPDVWFTLWRPIQIGNTPDAGVGKLALDRFTGELNRFLAAMRKGEQHLDELASPVSPAPFKP